MKTKGSIRYAAGILLTLLVATAAAGAEPPKAPPAASPTPLGGPSKVSGDKPIEVKGQARGASLLNLGGEKVQIKFIKLRKDYADEILNSPY